MLGRGASWIARRAEWVTTAGALVIRLAYVAATPNQRVAFDAADYHRLATSLARGEGFVSPSGGATAYRPPVYPLFLAGIYRLGGVDMMHARIVQAVLGTVTVVLVGVVARQLWDRRIALLSMAIAAVFPPFVLLGSVLFAEWLSVLLELAALALVLRYRAVGHTRWAVAAGVAFGTALLTRPNLVLSGIALGGLLLTSPCGRRVIALTCASLALLACLVPWTIRNAVRFDAFIPLTTQVGYTSAGTYNDVARTDPVFPATWHPAQADPTVAALIAQGGNEHELDARLQAYVREYALDHPGYVVEVTAWGVVDMLELRPSWDRLEVEEGLGIGSRSADVQRVAVWIVELVAILGALTQAARRPSRWVWAMPVLASAAVLPVTGFMRFRSAADPFLVMLTALAIAALIDRLHRQGPGVADSDG